MDSGILIANSAWSSSAEDPEEIFDLTKLNIVANLWQTNQELIMSDLITSSWDLLGKYLPNINTSISDFCS